MYIYIYIYLYIVIYVTCMDDVPQHRRIRVEFTGFIKEWFNESSSPSSSFTFLTLAVSFVNLQYVWWGCEVLALSLLFPILEFALSCFSYQLCSPFRVLGKYTVSHCCHYFKCIFSIHCPFPLPACAVWHFHTISIHVTSCPLPFRIIPNECIVS